MLLTLYITMHRHWLETDFVGAPRVQSSYLCTFLSQIITNLRQFKLSWMSTCLHVQDPRNIAMSRPVSTNEQLFSVVCKVFLVVVYWKWNSCILYSLLHLLSFYAFCLFSCCILFDSLLQGKMKYALHVITFTSKE